MWGIKFQLFLPLSVIYHSIKMSALHPKKRRKLSPKVDEVSNASIDSSEGDDEPQIDANFAAGALQWDLEQDYENRLKKKKTKLNTRLPIKTTDGRVQQVETPANNDEEHESDIESDGLEDTGEPAAEQPQVSSQEQILQAKEELARVAMLLNEEPEEHPGAFKSLAQLAQSSNPTIKKLALATELSCYKDVIPGYRIRPLKDTEKTEKVSKEVRKLRAYEQGMVASYQIYINDLAKHAKARRSGTTETTASLTTVAISCACTLILAVPHFNFRIELVKILVDKLSTKKIDGDFIKCRTTLETLFRDDEEGNASLDAVTMLTRMIKSRDYHVDESILNMLLHLRLLTEFSSKASRDSVDKEDALRTKVHKKHREFRTKKQRKQVKELKAVEKEFQEADALVSRDERDRIQADILKLVFITYFRILKARTPSLIGAVLEGLAKYAHLINQDFFADLLEVLRDLAAQAMKTIEHPSTEKSGFGSSDPLRAALLCTATAFTLLSAQDAAHLSIDLSFFISLLYDLLPLLAVHPDLELSSKTRRLKDPNDLGTPEPRVNTSTLSSLLMRTLTAALTPRNTSPERLAAFTHRLNEFVLHAPERTSTAIMGLLAQISKHQGRKILALWNTDERRGDGVFDALGGLETSKPFSGSCWAGELLRLHYSSGLREEAGGLRKNVLALSKV